MKILKNVQYYVLLAMIGALGLSSCQKENIGFDDLKKQKNAEQNQIEESVTLIDMTSRTKSSTAMEQPACATEINGTLYFIDRADNSLKKDPGGIVLGSSGSWPETNYMTSDESYLYVLHYNSIYKINSTNGSYSRLGPSGAWPASITKHITYHNGYLYIAHNNKIYKVNRTSGSWTTVGSGTLYTSSVYGMTALNGYLYIHYYNSIYKVDLNSGIKTLFGTAGAWPQNITHGLTSTKNNLYIAQAWPDPNWLHLYTIYSNGSWSRRVSPPIGMAYEMTQGPAKGVRRNYNLCGVKSSYAKILYKVGWWHYINF